MWIQRNIEKNLAVPSAERPALILTGCRQTGKTSLLKKVFPQHNYISLDLPLVAEQAIDQQREKNGLYLLTGSQQFSLMQGVTESLAGRDIFKHSRYQWKTVLSSEAWINLFFDSINRINKINN